MHVYKDGAETSTLSGKMCYEHDLGADQGIPVEEHAPSMSTLYTG